MWFAMTALALWGIPNLPPLIYLFLLLPSCFFFHSSKVETIIYIILAIVGCFYPIVPVIGGYVVTIVIDRYFSK